MINKVSAILIAMLVSLALPDRGYSCQFDTDCDPGSKCVKAAGSVYGVCVGGISPGNRNDRQPVYSPTDPNETYGDTCQFNTDCGPGSVCVKAGGIYGTCMRRR